MKEIIKDERLEEFYSKIDSLVRGIKMSDANIADKRDRVNAILDKLSNRTSEILSNNHLSKNKGLSEFITKIDTQISASIESWENTYRQLLDASALRDNFKDSFILIIYGKVKSGKSTLANFIADYSGAKPDFFRYDVETGGLRELNGGRLKVDDLECTDCIQGFKIPGLTVIDTPGLHSLTKANEELAKKYIGAADAVLYPMSSDSVCRHSEMKELAELIELGKSFFLVLTKSDDTEDDEVDGELVEKIVNLSDERRINIEEYTRKEVAAKLNSDIKNGLLGDIISVSVKKAVDSDIGEEEWEKSNIPCFYKMLSENLLPQSKIETVERLFSSTLASMIKPENDKSLCEIRSNVTDFRKFVISKSVELADMERSLKNACLIRARSEISRILAETKKQHSGSERAAKIAKSVNEIVSKELGKKVKSLLENLADGIERTIPCFTLNNDSLSEFLEIKKKTERIKVANKHLTSGVGGAAGGGLGAWGGAELGAAIGSIFPGPGTIIGGIVGAIGGGLLGSFFGSGVGKACSKSTFKDVVVGDNYDEVIINATAKSAEMVKQHISESLEFLRQNLLKPIEDTMNSVEVEIDKAIEEIKQEVKK